MGNKEVKHLKIRHIRGENSNAEIYGGDARTLKHLMSTFVEKITTDDAYSVVFLTRILEACADELELQQDERAANVMRNQLREVQLVTSAD